MSFQFNEIESILLSKSENKEPVEQILLDQIEFIPNHHIEFIQHFVNNNKNYIHHETILNYIIYPFRKEHHPENKFTSLEQITAQSLLKTLIKTYIQSNKLLEARTCILMYRNTIFSYSFRSVYHMCSDRITREVSKMLTDILEYELDSMIHLHENHISLSNELDDDIRYIIFDMIAEDYPSFLYMPLYEMRMRPRYSYIVVPKDNTLSSGLLKTYSNMNMVSTLFELGEWQPLEQMIETLDTTSFELLTFLDQDTIHSLLYILEECDHHLERCSNDKLPLYRSYHYYNTQTAEKFNKMISMMREKLSMVSA